MEMTLEIHIFMHGNGIVLLGIIAYKYCLELFLGAWNSCLQVLLGIIAYNYCLQACNYCLELWLAIMQINNHKILKILIKFYWIS